MIVTITEQELSDVYIHDNCDNIHPFRSPLFEMDSVLEIFLFQNEWTWQRPTIAGNKYLNSLRDSKKFTDWVWIFWETKLIDDLPRASSKPPFRHLLIVDETFSNSLIFSVYGNDLFGLNIILNGLESYLSCYSQNSAYFSKEASREGCHKKEMLQSIDCWGGFRMFTLYLSYLEW